ncbi:hypothetical protein GOV13_03085 [Candidatus Pacearchaeota archaeon]|nr:hypothetical protein [Candidatus Pacearchaeota archaeon]
MDYKLCILAAGKNERVSYAEDFPIAILPIGTSSALSRIINKFPRELEIIIAVGYKSELVKDFIRIAYPDRKIKIVEISFWDAPGSGPGKSLLLCKNYLQCPFIFTSADTIVADAIPEPSKNWVGVSQISDSSHYCVADSENGFVTKLYDKIDTPSLLKVCKNYKTILNNAFIGMAGIFDYETFWNGLERNQEIEKEEMQVSNGLSELIAQKIETFTFFNWFDVGSEAGYNLANRFFEKNAVIAKPDEFLYFEGGKVIKYFREKEIVKQRVERSLKLRGIVPELVDVAPNFYSYNFIEGKTLAKVNDVAMFRELLDYAGETVWKEKKLSDDDFENFRLLCKKAYYNKTMGRVEKMHREQGIKDVEEIINGEKVPKLSTLLSEINWDGIFSGVPVTFHGDFQPENILICDKGFQLIDWRHNFADSVEHGDIYYDFAKLHHALIVTHDVIRKNQFEIKENNGVISYDFFLKSNLVEYKDLFEKFVVSAGYDLDKLKIVSALTFINIAPLHHTPYNKFLYYLGKYSLYKELKRQKEYKAIESTKIENPLEN